MRDVINVKFEREMADATAGGNDETSAIAIAVRRGQRRNVLYFLSERLRTTAPVTLEHDNPATFFADVVRQVANSYVDEKKYHDAVSVLEHAVATLPKSRVGWVLLDLCEHSKKKIEGQPDACKRTLELCESHFPTMSSLHVAELDHAAAHMLVWRRNDRVWEIINQSADRRAKMTMREREDHGEGGFTKAECAEVDRLLLDNATDRLPARINQYWLVYAASAFYIRSYRWKQLIPVMFDIHDRPMLYGELNDLQKELENFEYAIGEFNGGMLRLSYGLTGDRAVAKVTELMAQLDDIAAHCAPRYGPHALFSVTLGSCFHWCFVALSSRVPERRAEFAATLSVKANALLRKGLTLYEAAPGRTIQLSDKRTWPVVRFPLKASWSAIYAWWDAGGTHSGKGNYCYDFLGVRWQPEHRNFSAARPMLVGEPKLLSDLVGFGEELVAVFDGTVVHITDCNPDQPLGSEPYAGNFLQVKSDEHPSVVAHYFHIQENSRLVGIGAQVRKGQPVCRLGNSGSGEPHLHFGLLDARDGWSRPFVFEPSTVMWDRDMPTVAPSPVGPMEMETIAPRHFVSDGSAPVGPFFLA